MEQLAPKSIDGTGTGGPAPVTPPTASHSQQSVASVIGEIVWMMTMSPTHRHFFISDLEWLLMTPVINSQFRLYRDDNGKPAGVIFWASLSEEVEARLNSGATKLAPQDWKSGDRLWVVDVIDLIGGKMPAMIEDMRRTVFKGKPFKFHQTQPNGKREVVEVKG